MELDPLITPESILFTGYIKYLVASQNIKVIKAFVYKGCFCFYNLDLK